MGTIKHLLSVSVLALCTVFGLVVSASAQTALPQLGSRADAITHGVENARKSVFAAWTVNQFSSINRTWSGPSTLWNIVEAFNVQLKISARAGEIFSYGAEVGDSEGATLFDAIKLGQVISSGANDVPVNLFLSYTIPVHFDANVSSAEFVANIPGVDPGPYPLAVTGNTVTFVGDWSGRGRLNVIMVSGNTRSYDLEDDGILISSSGPVKEVTQQSPIFSGTSSSTGGKMIIRPSTVSIEGIVGLNNPKSISDRLPSFGGKGHNRAYEVGIPIKGASFPISVSTSEDAIPLGYKSRRHGSWVRTWWPATNGVASVKLSVGTHYVKPVWNPLEFQEPDPSFDPVTP